MGSIKKTRIFHFQELLATGIGRSGDFFNENPGLRILHPGLLALPLSRLALSTSIVSPGIIVFHPPASKFMGLRTPNRKW
jgi:hypothetical protein